MTVFKSWQVQGANPVQWLARIYFLRSVLQTFDNPATDLASVVPVLLHYLNLPRLIGADVVQKRGNHRDELGGVKGHAHRVRSDRSHGERMLFQSHPAYRPGSEYSGSARITTEPASIRPFRMLRDRAALRNPNATYAMLNHSRNRLA